MNDPLLESRVIKLEQQVKAMERILTMRDRSQKGGVQLSPIYELFPHPVIDHSRVMQMVHSSHKQVNANANDK